jgi:hypothetical protein
LNKTRIFALIGLFAAAAANASAQSFGGQFSYASFGIYTTNPSVFVTNIDGGPYDDGYPTMATGSGYNLTELGQYHSSSSPYSTYGYGSNEVENISIVNGSGNPSGPGTASQFHGEYYDYLVTNTSLYNQGLYINVRAEQYEQVYGGGFADSYAGVEEFGGAGIDAYNDISMDASGIPSVYSYGGFINYGPYSAGRYYSYAIGSFDDVLTPGETVELQFYASGYSSATVTPGPMAAVPFALAAVAGSRKRRRKA